MQSDFDRRTGAVGARGDPPNPPNSIESELPPAFCLLGAEGRFLKAARSFHPRGSAPPSGERAHSLMDRRQLKTWHM